MTTANFSLRRLASVRAVATIAVLTLAWCGLWQDISIANVVSGVSLAVATLAFGLGTSVQGTVRLGPMMKLLGVVLVDLVKSTIDVASEAITPGDDTDEAVIEVTVSPDARRHFFLLVVCITLTPGTAVVDADPDTGSLYLHLLHYDKADEVRAHMTQLADLAQQALPVGDPHAVDPVGVRSR